MRLYSRKRVFFITPQARIAPSKNGSTYDACSSGSIIYAYVGGNPISFTDPMGLWIFQQSTGNLYSEGNNPSAITFVGSGYFGAVGYQNNGATESLGSVGPIPTGNYTIGAQGTYVTNSGKVLPGAMS